MRGPKQQIHARSVVWIHLPVPVVRPSILTESEISVTRAVMHCHLNDTYHQVAEEGGERLPLRCPAELATCVMDSHCSTTLLLLQRLQGGTANSSRMLNPSVAGLQAVNPLLAGKYVR